MKTGEQSAPQSGGWKTFRQFFRQVRLSWGWILLTLAISIAYYAVVSYIPGSTAALYAGEFTTAAIMGVVVNYLGTLVLSLVSSICQLIAEARSVRSARNSLWQRMMNIRTDHYDANDPGRLLSAVTSDAEATVTALITVVVSVPSLLIYLFMCLAQVSAYSPRLLAVLFVLVPVYALYGFFMGRWQFRTGNAIQTRIGGLTGFLSERIRNLSLIKAFATEQKEEDAGIETAESLYKANVQYQYINGIVTGYTMFTEAVGIVLAVIWGSMLLRNGEIDLQAWLAFFLFVPMINMVLRQFSLMWTNIKELQGRAARMGALMAAPQEDLRSQGSKDIPKGDIRLQNVQFGYTEGQTVLKDVSCTIPAGKRTAIVGLSGSGKTTILRLLEQLYLPGSGSITVDGRDINEFALAAWRGQISYVTQDATMFSGTVRECLTYGVPGSVSDEQLAAAAKAAGIYDFIMAQPDGFDSRMAIWGGSLSGGQKQRMVIARELLKNAGIVLLDEPTSALDAETAAQISDVILQRFEGKTCVTVTHELNFIANADQILVMDGGTLVGCGTHSELMENCPLYRELAEEQSCQEVYAK